MLLTLEQLVNVGIANNVTKVIVDSVVQYGDCHNLTLPQNS